MSYMKSFIYRNTPIWDSVKEAVTSDCRSRYKSRKNGFKKHFSDHGGYDNLETARRHPPPGMEEDLWNETINKLFLDEGYKKQSKSNAENRANHLYEGYHGTSSMASKRHKQKQQMEGEPSLIDGFKAAHYKFDRWINDLAKNHHERMIEERDARRHAGESPVDEAEILRNVLGEGRGHTNGVGRNLKFVSRYPDFSTQRMSQQDEINTTVQKKLEEMQQCNIDLLQALRNQFPNFQPPPMPSFLSARSQQSNENGDEETSNNEE